MDTREYATNASGDRFQVFKTPTGHWRAHQVDGVDRNFANIPASITSPTRASLLRELTKHWSN